MGPSERDPAEAFRFEAIGVARTPYREKLEAPRQPRAAEGVAGTIELAPGRGFEDALCDLDAWERIWVLFVFHANVGTEFRPKVLPPRSDVRRGVFATRSPHRPNPIGMSVLRLDSVAGLVLSVRDVDLLDGTPVLDVKPYVAYTDAFPDAGSGWLAAADPRPAWSVELAPLAAEQARFLADEHGVAVGDALTRALALGPQPHAYRRIRVEADGRSRIAWKAWRAWFVVEGPVVRVVAIGSGARDADLAAEGDPELAPHRAFVARFGHKAG